MSSSDTPHGAAHGAEHASHTAHYIKIWGILIVLLVISIMGPFIGVKIITLITAFGIAFVKAFLVAKNFMHLDVEKKVVWYMLGACLAIILVFFAAIAPDVMNHEGSRWVNVAANAETARREAEHAAGGGAHGSATGPAHGEAVPAHGEAAHAEPAPAHGEAAPAHP